MSTLAAAQAPLRAAAWPLLLLPSRLVLFALGQALLALFFTAARDEGAWAHAAAFWPLTAAAVNLVCLALLALALRDEGLTLREVWRPARAGLRRDLKWLAGLLLVLGPIGWLPGAALAAALHAPAGAVVQPLPLPAALVALVLFPVTIALVELPLYFGYVRPRLEKALGAWPAMALSCGFLAAQHLALPLVPDARYLVWRGLMFLPFAVLVGVALRRRPSLMPWLMGVHALMDAATAAVIVGASL
jgi:hypothetical protein